MEFTAAKTYNTLRNGGTLKGGWPHKQPLGLGTCDEMEDGSVSHQPAVTVTGHVPLLTFHSNVLRHCPHLSAAPQLTSILLLLLQTPMLVLRLLRVKLSATSQKGVSGPMSSPSVLSKAPLKLTVLNVRQFLILVSFVG